MGTPEQHMKKSQKKMVVYMAAHAGLVLSLAIRLWSDKGRHAEHTWHCQFRRQASKKKGWWRQQCEEAPALTLVASRACNLVHIAHQEGERWGTLISTHVAGKTNPHLPQMLRPAIPACLGCHQYVMQNKTRTGHVKDMKGTLPHQ